MKVIRALTLFLALALLGFALLALSAPAALANPGVLRVTVNGATSGSCGTLADWSNACDLQHALKDVAVAGDELWVASGTYVPTGITRTATFQLRTGIALYGGFAGSESVRTQRNFTTNVTILSGDIGTPGDASDNAYHVVTGSRAWNTAVLDGFTVTGGNADGASDSAGGGTYILGGSPTLINITFSNNSASDGGGMFSYSSSPTLMNVTFSGNSATYGGGGMTNVYYSIPTLISVTFSGNFAVAGGGMDNEHYSSPTLTNVTFISNTGEYWGGGMYNYYGSEPTLTNVTFISNSASANGGGMDNRSASPTLTNVSFISNTAGGGGGMHNWDGSPKVTNATFFGNSADSIGGGLMTEYPYSSPNSSTVRNAIFWGNTSPNGSQIFLYGDAPNLSDSIVQGGYPYGTHILATDPRLGTLGAWGGNTQTIPLLPGSSAIDAGNDAICPATDQRGKPRVGRCDIGAFEFQGYQLTKTGGDHQTTLIDTPFAQPLQVTLTEAGSPLPLGGVPVTFTAPASGGSAAWSGSLGQTVTTNASGAATAGPPTANGIAGSYTVTANTAGATSTVSFTLTNLLNFYLPMVKK